MYDILWGVSGSRIVRDEEGVEETEKKREGEERGGEGEDREGGEGEGGKRE